MKTHAQSRARELSRMHPADRRLSLACYPRPNSESFIMPTGRGSTGVRPAPANVKDPALISEAQALRDIERALATARGAKALLSMVLVGVDPDVVKDARNRALRRVARAARAEKGAAQ